LLVYLFWPSLHIHPPADTAAVCVVVRLSPKNKNFSTSSFFVLFLQKKNKQANKLLTVDQQQKRSQPNSLRSAAAAAGREW
jgi:hypothetical protein